MRACGIVIMYRILHIIRQEGKNISTKSIGKVNPLVISPDVRNTLDYLRDFI